jgi:hypothetical protein
MCDYEQKPHKETPPKPSHKNPPKRALKIKEKWDPQANHKGEQG